MSTRYQKNYGDRLSQINDDHAPREKNSGGKYIKTNAHMYVYQKETLITHADHRLTHILINL